MSLHCLLRDETRRRQVLTPRVTLAVVPVLCLVAPCDAGFSASCGQPWTLFFHTFMSPVGLPRGLDCFRDVPNENGSAWLVGIPMAWPLRDCIQSFLFIRAVFPSMNGRHRHETQTLYQQVVLTLCYNTTLGQVIHWIFNNNTNILHVQWQRVCIIIV